MRNGVTGQTSDQKTDAATRNAESVAECRVPLAGTSLAGGNPFDMVCERERGHDGMCRYRGNGRVVWWMETERTDG